MGEQKTANGRHLVKTTKVLGKRKTARAHRARGCRRSRGRHNLNSAHLALAARLPACSGHPPKGLRAYQYNPQWISNVGERPHRKSAGNDAENRPQAVISNDMLEVCRAGRQDSGRATAPWEPCNGRQSGTWHGFVKPPRHNCSNAVFTRPAPGGTNN